jgi:gamma-F420-2:alpha-L-glutamate ligase
MSNIGWVIYSREDAEKNKGFIRMLKEDFDQYNVELKLVILEEIDKPEVFVKNANIDFAINRSRNSYIAELLEKREIRVFNNSMVTDIANNKGKNYKYLEGIVPFLPIIYQREVIGSHESIRDFTYPYVIKSCCGHGGSQVFLVHNEDEKKQALSKIKDEYVIQKLCSDIGKDVRVYVIGNKIVKAVLRTSKESFKSNYSLGGSAREYNLDNYEIAMVKQILNKFQIDYGGIDFTFHNGKAVFNEIEDAVGARMLYSVCDIDIAKLFVDYIIGEIS